jgi:hypothetical protein
MNDMNDTNTDDGGGTLAIREAATEVVTMAKAAGPTHYQLSQCCQCSRSHVGFGWK